MTYRDPYSQRSGSTIIINNGGGPVIFIGAIFLIAGIGAMYALHGNVVEASEKVPLYIVSGIFTLLGFVMSFGRSRFEIDPLHKRWVKRMYMLFPVSQKEGSLQNCSQVLIKRVVHNSGKNTSIYYPVFLMDGKNEIIKVESLSEPLQARRSGEKLSRAFEVPLLDITDPSSPNERAYDKLDISLRDKLRSDNPDNIDVDILSRPVSNSRCSFRDQPGEIVISIPPSGYSPIAFIPFFFSLIFSAIFGFSHLIPLITGDSVDSSEFMFAIIFSMFFILVPNIITLAMAMKFSFKSEEIIINDSNIRIKVKTPLGSKYKEMAIDELEEIKMPQRPDISAIVAGNHHISSGSADNPSSHYPSASPPPVIQALISSHLFNFSSRIKLISDDSIIEIGRYIPANDLKWLKEIIEASLLRGVKL